MHERYMLDSKTSSGSYDERTNGVILAGKWDLATWDSAAKEELRRLTARLQPSSSASIDLSAVRFMDSSVINEIFHTFKRLTAAGGSLRLLVGDERIERLLRIAQVDRVVEIVRKND